jgi:hypothetical protein
MASNPRSSLPLLVQPVSFYISLVLYENRRQFSNISVNREGGRIGRLLSD